MCKAFVMIVTWKREVIVTSHLISLLLDPIGSRLKGRPHVGLWVSSRETYLLWKGKVG